MVGLPELSFSQRTDFGPPDPLATKMRAIFDSHSRPVNLSETNPTKVGISLPQWGELLAQSPSVYQPDPRGLAAARTTVARTYRDRAAFDPQDILLTSSTSEAYSFVLQTLCDPGDAVLVPQPSYPLFEQLARLSGVRLEPYSITYDGAFHVETARLPAALELARSRVKAIFAVSPNNPTGNSLRTEEIAALRAYGLPLIVDEVFRHYRWAEEEAGDPLDNAEGESLTIVLDGLSKRAGAPGLKLGWLAATGRYKRAFVERAEWVSDAFLSPNMMVQNALPLIFEREKEVQTNIRERLGKGREILARPRLQERGVTVLRAEGGWTALLQFPATMSEERWWRALSESGLWLVPGSLYGLASPAPVFALSLLTPAETMNEAIERIGAVVTQTKNAP